MTRYNPFANFGNIVSGPNFIGREEYLRIIDSRIIDPEEEGGSLAIVGVHRIGKSSLVYQALMARKPELHKKKLLPIWINLTECKQPDDFFHTLITLCKNELEELNLGNTAIRTSANAALKQNLTWSESIRRIKRFFTLVRREGVRVIFILDEFDYARTLFENDIQHIQGLRDLAIYPDLQVNWVVISRRTINEIETKAIGISNLQGIFLEPYISVFNDGKDMSAFFQRLAGANLTITQNHKDLIDSYCGKHPYLLAILSYQLVAMYSDQEGEIDVAAAFYKVEQQFLRYYDKVIHALKEDEDIRYKKLLQILFGPAYGLEQTDINEMLAYGLIRPNPEWMSEQDDEAAYVAFSQHFQHYLNLQKPEVEMWPLLGQTEHELRRVIRVTLAKKYGDGVYSEQCLTRLEVVEPKLAGIFAQCRKLQKKDSGDWSSASVDILDYTYPRDLFTIMFADWQLFLPTFGKHKKDRHYWDDRGQLLTKMRNALAHQRIDHVMKSHYIDAQRYCEEILAITRTIDYVPF